MNEKIGPEGNYYDKYASKNPIERFLMSHFFSNAKKLLRSCTTDVSSVLEAGCGEGHFTHFLRSVYSGAEISAFDIGAGVISYANERYASDNVEFYEGSIYEISKDSDSFSLVVASEVLEHLEEPCEALRELVRVSRDMILITVPREPLWRLLNLARFKYIRDFGNTPGHINHWTKSGIKRLAASLPGVRVAGIRSSLPWTLLLLKKDGSDK